MSTKSCAVKLVSLIQNVWSAKSVLVSFISVKTISGVFCNMTKYQEEPEIRWSFHIPTLALNLTIFEVRAKILVNVNGNFTFKVGVVNRNFFALQLYQITMVMAYSSKILCPSGMNWATWS